MDLLTIGALITAGATVVLAWIGWRRLKSDKSVPITVELKTAASSDELRRALPSSSLNDWGGQSQTPKPLKVPKSRSSVAPENDELQEVEVDEIPATRISSAPFLSQQYVADLGTKLTMKEMEGDVIKIKLRRKSK